MSTNLADQMKARVPIVSKYRSRLMLSYRTNISGTPLTERIPFRVLVLGQFTGLTARESGLTPAIAERRIRSIRLGQAGTSVDDYMREIKPWMRVPKGLRPLLEASVPGSVSFAEPSGDGYRSTLTVVVTDGDKEGPITADVSGTARFRSTRADNNQADIEADDFKVGGLINLEKAEDGSLTPAGPIELRISGAATKGLVDAFNQPAGVLAIIGDGEVLRLDPADVELVPIVDLSGESSSTRQFELFVHDADGEGGQRPRSARMPFKRALPFTSTTGFTPDAVASNVPELKRLKVIRDLVQEVPSTARNNPAFHAALRVALPAVKDDASARKVEAAQAFQAWARAAYPELALEPPAEAPDPVPLSTAGEEWLNELLKPVGGSASGLYAVGGEEVVALVDQAAETGIETDAGKMVSLVFRDRDPSVTDAVRIANALAALFVNLPAISTEQGTARLTYSELIEGVGAVAETVDGITGRYLDGILHDGEFQTLESNWLSLADLARHVTSDEVIVDFYDATKDEIGADLVDNRVDIFGSVLFNRVYVDEYDRYGGRPFASMVGLYAFDSGDDDIAWLHGMMSVCAGAHCPFVASVSPQFFNGRLTMEEVASVTDLDAIMSHPRFGKWNALREEDWAAYIGLALPRYMVRLPWDAADETQGSRNDRYNRIGYRESVDPGRAGDQTNFLWGSAAMLFARNVVRSFEASGWAQHIRGPMGGGEIKGLVAYTYRTAEGKMALVPPVEIAMPDYREFQFARNGLIPLVHKKGTSTATFFSSQSVKKAREFVEEDATQNSALVTNLAYTYSTTIIAHYVKVMMREYIGTSADAEYIQQVISDWLGRFVTTVVNPDDLTLLYYPFKAVEVKVEPRPGAFGWYAATISVLPHIQFEGMDVELRIEAALGGGGS